ncbi:MAG: type II secretion system protein N [Gammaproteobacteria bacterium]
MRLRLTKTTLLVLLIFISSYVLFMLQQLPARTVVGWLPPQSLQGGAIQLNGVSGTLWQGQVAQLRLNGLSVSNLSWQLQGWPLLWGDIALGFRFRQSDASGAGRLNTDIAGEQLLLSAVQGRFPAAQLMPLFYGFPIVLAGEVNAVIEQATLSKGQQLSLQGELLWREAALTAPQHIPLGDVQVKMQAREQGTILTVQDQGGPLELQGQISLEGDGTYQTTLAVSARPAASPALAQSISILGQRDAQGRVQILQRGKLPNW